MSHLGARVRKVLEEKGITQSALAKLVGVKQQTISYICSHESPAATSRYSVKIAQVLGVNPLWLQSGEGDQLDPMVKIDLEGIDMRVTRLPVLRMEEVTHYLVDPDSWETRRALMTDAKVGKKAFSVELQGDSMAPTFKHSDKIVVDTELDPLPGDFVAACVNGEVMFRRFRKVDTKTFELVPSNGDWPTIRSHEHEVKIIGVMAEHRSYRPEK